MLVDQSKADRAWQLIDEAAARRLQRLGRLREARCGQCDRVMFEYEPPASVLLKCRRCSTWNRIVTEVPPT